MEGPNTPKHISLDLNNCLSSGISHTVKSTSGTNNRAILFSLFETLRDAKGKKNKWHKKFLKILFEVTEVLVIIYFNIVYFLSVTLMSHWVIVALV